MLIGQSFLRPTFHVLQLVPLKITYKWTNIMTRAGIFSWPCGPTDKASDYESGDCRFESCQGQPFYPPRKTGHSVHCSESSFNKSTNYTNTLSWRQSLIWTYVQLEKTTLSPKPVENQAHNNGIQFPLLEGDKFHNKIEKELCAPGWARTTNLSVNSQTR